MCVIINKRNGVKLASKETLQECFTHNPDGAGICWTVGTKENPAPINLEKGFMDFNSFWAFIEKLKRKYRDDDLVNLSMILHCRITTHGETSQENTHPFPISKDDEMLGALHLRKLDCAVAHNGIVSSVNVPKASKLSDTGIFIKTQLSAFHKLNDNWMKDKEVMQVINDIIGSKLSVLTTDGEINTSGVFYDKEDGMEYSNLNWEWSYGLRGAGYNSYYSDQTYYQDVYGKYGDDCGCYNDYDMEYMSTEDIIKLYYNEEEHVFTHDGYICNTNNKDEFYIYGGMKELMAFEQGNNNGTLVSVEEFKEQYKGTYWLVEFDYVVA